MSNSYIFSIALKKSKNKPIYAIIFLKNHLLKLYRMQSPTKFLNKLLSWSNDDLTGEIKLLCNSDYSAVLHNKISL